MRCRISAETASNVISFVNSVRIILSTAFTQPDRPAPRRSRALPPRRSDGGLRGLPALAAISVMALAVLLPAGASAQSDDRPYLGLDSPSVREGDSGATTMTFTARLTDANGRTQAGARTITAHYQVLSENGNTATAGKDFTAASGSISFSPGETSKTIGVTVLGDTDVEGDETLTLKWTRWENVLLAHYSKTGTITNDDEDSPVTVPVAPPEKDDRPYLGLDSPSVQEGDSGAATLTFTARLTDANGRAMAGAKRITANYQVLSESGNTATAGKDFVAEKGTISIAPGETSKTIDVTVPRRHRRRSGRDLDPEVGDAPGPTCCWRTTRRPARSPTTTAHRTKAPPPTRWRPPCPSPTRRPPKASPSPSR